MRVVTRRSTNMRTESQLEPSRKRSKMITKNLISAGLQPSLCVGQISLDLLQASILRMRTQIWYSVLPSINEKIYDISQGTKQSWDSLFVLLVHCGLLLKHKSKGDVLTVNTTLFREFEKDISGELRLHSPPLSTEE